MPFFSFCLKCKVCLTKVKICDRYIFFSKEDVTFLNRIIIEAKKHLNLKLEIMSKQLTKEQLAGINGGTFKGTLTKKHIDSRKNKTLEDRYSRVFRLFKVVKGA